MTMSIQDIDDYSALIKNPTPIKSGNVPSCLVVFLSCACILMIALAFVASGFYVGWNYIGILTVALIVEIAILAGITFLLLTILAVLYSLFRVSRRVYYSARDMYFGREYYVEI